ncbi:MAG: hypothetical protein V7731_21135 [Amphritea sp.]
MHGDCFLHVGNDYALHDWEGRSNPLRSGEKITSGEIRAAVCRKNGLSQKEAARELHCSLSNIKQYWKSIYHKLHTSDVVVALDKLSDLGALVKLGLFSLLINMATGYDDNIARRVRTRRSRDFATLEEASDLPRFLENDFLKNRVEVTA